MILSTIGFTLTIGIFYCILILRYDFSLNEIIWLKRASKIIGILSTIVCCWLIIQSFIGIKNIVLHNNIYGVHFLNLLSYKLKNLVPTLIPLFIVSIFSGICGLLLKLKQGMPSKKTSGCFGSAEWANKNDLISLGAYSPKTGLFIGTDEKGQNLYLPLCNKLTISPPGGGKTTSSTIPALLSHNGPVFIFDIKGELWATTARYRAETFGRQLIVIDPYGVTASKDFTKDKSEVLRKKYYFNPFDWVPEFQGDRDRMINAFASSFIINEGGYSNHFDENAKILIRGYIDFIMSAKSKEERTLSTLYGLMSEDVASATNTFNQMLTSSGRAEAAANQISRVGNDEKGSILSTSYRQIDWMSDYNIQATLSHSNFDLRDFLKGNMDIYIVLPEDQIKEHSRLVRMMLSLLMSLIVQANPSELPKQKILFLLDELAQLGYCPDVEQCIEVLRSRGVVVWTVFQSLNQIELFKKPDLFKGAPLKQIFTTDDTKTMQWIQAIGGKKTVVTQTVSTNKGTSRQSNKIIAGGTSSQGESESAHETGVDLIPLNEIRELPSDEQFIFLHGAKPIRCKKIRYFECKEFNGKYDKNPLESC